MTWVLIHAGRIVARGSYAEVLDTAEDWLVLARAQHPDGTELPPRLARGWSILPEAMAPRFVAEAA